MGYDSLKKIKVKNFLHSVSICRKFMFHLQDDPDAEKKQSCLRIHEYTI